MDPKSVATKAIASKADRILARLNPSSRGADEQRRQASALLHLATQVSGDASYAARASNDAREVNDEDRQRAGEMVENLAQRAMDKPSLQEALGLFEIALSLHNNEEWPFSKGIVQVQLHDFAGAKQSFEAVRGYHASSSKNWVKQCELQLSGVDLDKAPAPKNAEEAQTRRMFLFYMNGAKTSKREATACAPPAPPAPSPAAPPIPFSRSSVDPRCVVQAAKAIAAKGERTLASIKSTDRKADEKRREASALLKLASEVAGDPAFASRASDPTAEITPADRERAGGQVYSLASRASKTSDAIAYYDIALSLHNEGYWLYLKGILQQQDGKFADALRTFESVQGIYAQYAGPLAAQCRSQMSGTYNEEAQLDAALGWMKDAGAGKMADSMREVFASISKLSAGFQNNPDKPEAASNDFMAGLFNNMKATMDAESAKLIGQALEGDDTSDDGDEDAGSEDDSGEDSEEDSEEEVSPEVETDLEIAAETAQAFAEHLARGDFDAADAMLTKSAQLPGGGEDLRDSYLAMIDHDDDDDAPDDAEVTVMTSDEVNEDARQPHDLGWVYVAISGDDFNEAVTVIVTRENGELRIRDIEWGRP